MRRRKDPFEKPWVIIAAVVGIIAVVIIAAAFFMGGGSSAPAGSASQPSSANPTARPTLVVGVAPTAVNTQTPVTVPVEGVFVKVSYLGGFTGKYGIEGNMTTVKNSGERVFAIENATGAVSAVFRKDDSSKHEIVVEIWKDGTSRQVAKNSSSYGEASVTYTV
jgi:hypothetical protein